MAETKNKIRISKSIQSLKMNLELQGRVAVVTGGASGIGLACAQALTREGCRVAVWDVSGPHAVDVSDYAAVHAAVNETEAKLGPIAHLVHSAAVTSGKFGFPFTNLEPGDWARVLQVNMMGMVHVAQAIAPGMIARKDGTMVFIASIAGQIGSQTIRRTAPARRPISTLRSVSRRTWLRTAYA
jgi:2-hydroxycyclohexanecarboxyl-CoA dehydrogenase